MRGQSLKTMSTSRRLLQAALLSIIALSAHAQSIVTVAGGGTDDGHAATDVALYGVAGLAVDSRGNLYMAEQYANLIRKVSADGTITTLAGNGDAGDGGPATAAKFDFPQAVVVDSAGNIYVSDVFNNRVRRIDAATGNINTYVGGGDKSGDAAEGAGGTSAKISNPEALAFDRDGNLIVSEQDRIWRVNKNTRTLQTFTKELGTSYGMALASNGDIYIGDGFSYVLKYAQGSSEGTIVAGGGTFVGDGLPATAAVLRAPVGVAVDRDGNLFIADFANALVRKVDAKTGLISTYAGNGGYYDTQDGLPATQLPVGAPSAVTFDPQGNLYIADYVNGRVKRVDKTTGIMTYYAGGGSPPPGSPTEGIPATSARFDQLVAIGFDATGNLYAVDQGTNKVWRVDPSSRLIYTSAGVG